MRSKRSSTEISPCMENQQENWDHLQVSEASFLLVTLFTWIIFLLCGSLARNLEHTYAQISVSDCGLGLSVEIEMARGVLWKPNEFVLIVAFCSFSCTFRYEKIQEECLVWATLREFSPEDCYCSNFRGGKAVQTVQWWASSSVEQEF